MCGTKREFGVSREVACAVNGCRRPSAVSYKLFHPTPPAVIVAQFQDTGIYIYRCVVCNVEFYRENGQVKIHN